MRKLGCSLKPNLDIPPNVKEYLSDVTVRAVEIADLQPALSYTMVCHRRSRLPRSTSVSVLSERTDIANAKIDMHIPRLISYCIGYYINPRTPQNNKGVNELRSVTIG
jgi:hypothetical protein